MKKEITFEDFLKVDIRIGTIIEVNDFPKARKPAYQLTVDFGDLGIKKSSAQITDLYTKEELLNKQVSAIVNFKPRQIANFMSEILVIGVYNTNGNVVLLQASKAIKNGEQVS
ncbi:tRNA-binding protein [uncultured Polaribacter sp.]|uniref:tRNA-binding protein n=1 Tax=uncultured Polaribacter sp. TaxID=174711 RepID=UPI0026316162|nr:tRNA-binding protein [uncultured Polaribacter sp.]